ncbi:MAG: hypothetical protein IJU75_04935 [Clostridia bacterium]|nr:hypothetical protein [Clostridia bacterium]
MQIKSKKRAALFTCFLLIFLFVFQLTSGAVYYIYDINVPTVLQQKSLWCWAACIKSVLDYYSQTGYSQSDIVYATYGNYNNQTATASTVMNTLIGYGVHAHVSSGSMSMNSIQSNIGTSNQPIIAGLLYTNGNTIIGAHMVVLSGYENTADFKTVTYMNPADALYHTETYSYFCSCSNKSWVESINQLYLYS